MKNKRIYLLTIFYTVVFAVIFKFAYPEVTVASIATVIVLLALGLAIGSNYLVNRVKQKGTGDDK